MSILGEVQGHLWASVVTPGEMERNKGEIWESKLEEV